MMWALQKRGDRNSYQVVSTADEEITAESDLDPGAHPALQVVPEVPGPVRFLTWPARARERIVGGPHENVRHPAFANGQRDVSSTPPRNPGFTAGHIAWRRRPG
jgi:hypothetical protein